MGFGKRLFGGQGAALLMAAALLLGALAAPGRSAAEDDRLIRALENELAGSNLGYPQRIVGVSRMGRGSLAVSFWAQGAPHPDEMAAGVLADAWRIFVRVFPAAGFPVEVAVDALYPVEDEEGNVTTRVVGHFRLAAATFRRLREAGAGPENLLEEADTAMISLEALQWDLKIGADGPIKKK